MRKQFEPSPDEVYLDAAGLGQRWRCHEKTAQRRAKKFNIATLMFSNRASYPMSEILRVEREALNLFVGRKTQFPPQFTGINRSEGTGEPSANNDQPLAIPVKAQEASTR